MNRKSFRIFLLYSCLAIRSNDHKTVVVRQFPRSEYIPEPNLNALTGH